MIKPKDFFEAMRLRGVGLYAGVPDSLLSNFCAYIDDQSASNTHLIAANEGNAVALGMGYHMSTGKVAMVYMQNSGLGNIINPITSLADPEVYKVPMILVIGWRGEPGNKDEPQHIKQGRVTLAQLDVLEIPYWIIDASTNLDATFDTAFSVMRERGSPVALVVRSNTFSEYSPQNFGASCLSLTREDALEHLLNLFSEEDLVISTTGKASREIFEIRAKHGQKQSDLLTVGGMGHTASIALGVAIGQPDRRVICLDGDGSLIMHMGAMPVIANHNPSKFIHVILNNGSHESVGGQATSANVIDFKKLAEAVGYKGYAFAESWQGIENSWQEISKTKGPVLFEIKLKNGSRKNLGRPTVTAEQNKRAFMEHIGV